MATNNLHNTVRGKHPALMTHVVLGYPNLKESISHVLTMVDAGASFVELQIPFTDPMADGPTIMYANQEALKTGVSTLHCMLAMEQLAARVKVPLLFMSYFNLLLGYPGSVGNFCRDALQAGAQGLIVPDISPEETSEGFWEQAKKFRLGAIPIVSPVSTPSRLRAIAKVAGKNGFIYCVSTTGTTGARSKLPAELPQYLRRVRKVFHQPLAVGFGISNPGQVRALSGHAEIAIVGSASIDLIRKTPKASRKKKLAKFIRQLVG